MAFQHFGSILLGRKAQVLPILEGRGIQQKAGITGAILEAMDYRQLHVQNSQGLSVAVSHSALFLCFDLLGLDFILRLVLL